VPDDARVLDVFSRAQASGFSLLAFECFDAGCLAHVRAHRGVEGAGPFPEPSPQHVLVEVEVLADDEHAEERTREALVECLAQAQEAGEITDAVVAATPQQAAKLWALREDITESLHRWTPHKADVGLPVERLTDFVASFRRRVARALPGVEALIFGHVGDGNVHLNMLRPDGMSLDEFLARCEAFDDEMYGLIRDHGGSVSAEHGIGLLKRDYLHYTRSQDEIAMMRSIKATLDPGGLFNPGKIFEL
jgi:FAD/FMN-containing dehydrogenase